VKIGYFADGPWSYRALEQIIEDKHLEIVFIVPRFDSQDPVLKKWAEMLEIDYLPIEDVNQIDSISRLIEYGADLFVSMSFNQIVKKQILEAAPLGFINCHAGALPFYRGRNILNWALINGEQEFGVTVHYIDEGIDTGDIILQRMAEITDKDDYSTLMERAIILCADLLIESLVEINKGSVMRKPQSGIHPVGFYCGRRLEGDEWIDWNWSSLRIFNFVRAITKPGPYARTRLGTKEILVKRALLIKNAPKYFGTPGEVVGMEGKAVIVKTGDSTLRLDSFKIIQHIHVLASSNKKIERVRIGHRFS
jgi:methionyl-tRNA formyltransferase